MARKFDTRPTVAQVNELRDQVKLLQAEVTKLQAEKTQIREDSSKVALDLQKKLDDCFEKGREVVALEHRLRYLLHDRNCLRGVVADFVRQEDLVDGRAIAQPTPLGGKITIVPKYPGADAPGLAEVGKP